MATFIDQKIIAMCLKNKCLLPVILISFFISIEVDAQQNGTGIKLFFEKVYLHTDRNFYAGGDEIWFKAYLVNAQSNYPVNTSNTLYTELVDPSGNILVRQVIRMDSGYGVGDFKLGDSIAGGSYRIRAYTNWMKNFGPYFIFEKQIQVKNIAGRDAGEITAKKAAGSKVAATAMPVYNIQFFPEGGALVEGIESLVGFKATDASGNAVDVSGSIVTAAGDTVARFKSSHAGMGSFVFTPAPSTQYKAMVKYRQQNVVTDFAVATKDGYVIRVINTKADEATLKIGANAATQSLHPSGTVTIAAKHGGKLLYKEQLQVKDNQSTITIPIKDFPTGICSITLYDENLHPNCERLIYIQDKNPLTVNVTTNKPTYGPKDKVNVYISVTDAAQQPVKASLSLAAVDDGLEKASLENINTYLLLQTEVKGKIENAAAYFDINNPQRLQQLDLLLLTQGWREFLWRKMADTSIAIHYMPEQGISISGKILQRGSQKPMPDMNISLQAPDAKGDKWFTTRSDAQGNYFLDGIPLYGVQTLKINAANDKGEKAGQLFMDSLFGKPVPLVQQLQPFDTTAFARFAMDAANRYTVEKNNKWFTILPGVTVSGKTKTEFLRDGAYMSFGYPVDNFNITSADYSYDDLRNFLAKKVPGAFYDMETDGVYFLANGKQIRPRFVVDKREDVFDRIDYYSLPMQQVKSVTVRHLIGQPSFERTERADGSVRDLGTTPRDIFVINLSLKPGAFNQDPAKISTEVSGYYEAKSFYTPNYAVDKSMADQRATIYWAPLITTNDKGKAAVSFYNADPKTTIRIDVQGVTGKGTVIVAEKKYEVQ